MLRSSDRPANCKGRAFARHRFRADMAAMPRHDRVGDGQADAVARTVVAAVQALERFQHLFGIRHVEADAMVAYLQQLGTVMQSVK